MFDRSRILHAFCRRAPDISRMPRMQSIAELMKEHGYGRIHAGLLTGVNMCAAGCVMFGQSADEHLGGIRPQLTDPESPFFTAVYARVLPPLVVANASSAWALVPSEYWASAQDHLAALPWAARELTMRPSLSPFIEEHAMLTLTSAVDPSFLCNHVVAGIPKVPEDARHEVAERLCTTLLELIPVADQFERNPQALDIAYLDLLLSLGKPGRESADKVRKERAGHVAKSGSELYGWLPKTSPICPPRRLTMLAHAIWGMVAFERDSLSRYYPATAGGVQHDLSRAKRGKTVRARQGSDTEFEALGGNGVIVARYAAIERTNLEALRRGALIMSKPLAERTIRTLQRDAFFQRARGINPFTRLCYRGGIEAFAERAGIREQGASKEIRSLLEALQGYRGCNRSYPLALSFWLHAARPGRPSELRIDLGEALAPGYASELARSGARHGEAWLLPVLPIPSLPSVDNRVRARLYDLQWELLTEMRGALGDVEHGWELLPIVQVAADRAEVDSRSATKAVEHWLTAPDAWLKAQGPGRVTLIEQGALDLFREAKQRGQAVSEAQKRAHFARKPK